MNDLTHTVLAAELPDSTGWIVLAVSLLITIVWLAYLYR